MNAEPSDDELIAKLREVSAEGIDRGYPTRADELMVLAADRIEKLAAVATHNTVSREQIADAFDAWHDHEITEGGCEATGANFIESPVLALLVPTSKENAVMDDEDDFTKADAFDTALDLFDATLVDDCNLREDLDRAFEIIWAAAVSTSTERNIND